MDYAIDRIVGALFDEKLDSNPTKGGRYQLCVLVHTVFHGSQYLPLLILMPSSLLWGRRLTQDQAENRQSSQP
jgi:hypothetical protein